MGRRTFSREFKRSAVGLVLANGRHSLLGAWGSVEPDELHELLALRSGAVELLADRAAQRRLADSFSFERAVINLPGKTWSQPVPSPELTIRLLRKDDPLDHLPSQLREELAGLESEQKVWAGFFDQVAVSFAYSPSQSERHADLSIDTLEAYRRRGFASAVMGQLISELRRADKVPVWCAVEDNRASLALARRLGFTPTADELFVCEL